MNDSDMLDFSLNVAHAYFNGALLGAGRTGSGARTGTHGEADVVNKLRPSLA